MSEPRYVVATVPSYDIAVDHSRDDERFVFRTTVTLTPRAPYSVAVLRTTRARG